MRHDLGQVGAAAVGARLEPVGAALGHLAAGFRGERHEGLLKHLRHYSQPAPWVAQHWQE